MASFSHSVEVPVPPREVFPWLLEADRVPRWTGSLDEYQQLTPGPLDVGSRLRQSLEIGGSRFVVDLEITRYDPPKEAESRFATSGVHIVNSYKLAPVPGGTRIVQAMEAKPTSFGARMLIPVVQPRLERKLTEDLERLRALLAE